MAHSVAARMAHAPPIGAMSTLKASLTNLPRTLPKAYARWKEGFAIDQELRARWKAQGGKFQPEKLLNQYKFPRLWAYESQIYVDAELPQAFSHEKYQTWMQWKFDAQRYTPLVCATLCLGPLGLLLGGAWFLAKHERMPSAFITSEEELVNQRLQHDFRRIQWASNVRHDLMRNNFDGSGQPYGVFTGQSEAAPINIPKKDYEEFLEMFDMDAITVQDGNMTLFDKWVPKLGKFGGLEYTSRDMLRVQARFLGLPWRFNTILSLFEYHRQYFSLIYTDDIYLRQKAPLAEWSFEELFEAAYRRALVRQEESEITRQDLIDRMTIWLNLSDPAYWADKQHKMPTGAGSRWNLLLAANVFCDPPYDPELEKEVYARMQEDPEAAQYFETDMKKAFDIWNKNNEKRYAGLLDAQFQQYEQQRFESQMDFNRKIDDFVTAVETATKRADVQEVEEVIVEEVEEDNSLKLIPGVDDIFLAKVQEEAKRIESAKLNARPPTRKEELTKLADHWGAGREDIKALLVRETSRRLYEH